MKVFNLFALALILGCSLVHAQTPQPPAKKAPPDAAPKKAAAPRIVAPPPPDPSVVAQQQLAKSLPAEKGRDLLKQVRVQLIVIGEKGILALLFMINPSPSGKVVQERCDVFP